MTLNKIATLCFAASCVMFAHFSYALPSDRDQPIHIQADTADLDDKKGTAIYRGTVVVTQGTLKITGDTVTVVQQANGDIKSFKSVGRPAYYEQIPDVDKDLVKAYGITIEYFAQEDKIVITDQAKVVQTNNTFRGEKITYDTIAETVVAGRAPAGTVSKEEPRVNMVIQPKKKASEPDNKAESAEQ